jgi:hypothetical protein
MFARRLPRPTSLDRRRGVAVVEFAVLAPVFVVLVVGTIGASKMLHAQSIMAQALREGGRLAAMDWSGALPDGMTPNEKVEQDIRAFMSASGIDTKDVKITITYAEGATGTPFSLGDPDNYMKLFEIRAHQPHSDANVWCSYLTEGKGLTARIVMRAGRATKH